MAKDPITQIICLDDHKALVTTGILEDVRRRFSDSSRYKVVTFPEKHSFLQMLSEKKERGACRIAIMGIHDDEEHLAMINNLMIGVRQSDPETGLILLVPGDKAESIKQNVSINADAYIPKNDNAILRIHNTVKRIISEKNLAICRKRRNISLMVLSGFLALVVILLLVTFLLLADYF